MNWLTAFSYAVAAIGAVLLGVGFCYLPSAWKRHKVEKTLIVAERTARQARTKGVVALEDPSPDGLHLEDMFGHGEPFSESEVDIYDEFMARLELPRPYIREVS